MLKTLSAALLVASVFTAPVLAASGKNSSTMNAKAQATTSQPAATSAPTTAKPAVKKVRHAVRHHRHHKKMTQTSVKQISPQKSAIKVQPPKSKQG